MTATTDAAMMRHRRGWPMLDAIAAEWTKLWSVRTTWYCLVAGVVLTVIQAASVTETFLNGHLGFLAVDGMLPAAFAARVAIQGAQYALVALAMLTITAEYATGGITSSLQWVPRRVRFTAAKVAVVAIVSAVAAVAFGGVGIGVAAAMGGERVLVDGADVASTLGLVGAYGALVAGMTAGLALLIRSAAGTLTTVFLLLLVLPALLSQVPIEAVAWIGRHMPGAAGDVLFERQAPVAEVRDAFLMLLVWAAGALAAGTLRLTRRDA